MVMVMHPADIPVMEFRKGFNGWQDSQFIMFPLITDPSAYLISKS